MELGEWGSCSREGLSMMPAPRNTWACLFAPSQTPEGPGLYLTPPSSSPCPVTGMCYVLKLQFAINKDMMWNVYKSRKFGVKGIKWQNCTGNVKMVNNSHKLEVVTWGIQEGVALRCALHLTETMWELKIYVCIDINIYVFLMKSFKNSILNYLVFYVQLNWNWVLLDGSTGSVLSKGKNTQRISTFSTPASC